MDNLTTSDWIAILAAAGMIVALIGNLFAMRDRVHRRSTEMASLLAEIRADTKFIKERVYELNNMMHGMDLRMSEMDRRIVKVEERAASAHRRLDEIVKG